MSEHVDEFYRVTREIADRLGEREPTPRSQIRRILHVIGAERTQAFVDQALEVEANGGMLLPDGSRKRTLGGVFFRLVRDRVTVAERRRIWPYQDPARLRGAGNRTRQGAPSVVHAAPAPLPLFAWEMVDEIIAEVSDRLGEAATVKITLIGRPGEIIERQEVIILVLQSTGAPSLPKGLPAPPEQLTKYLVFVSQKQWKRVADTLQNPADKLIIEGYPVHHPRFAGITVYATQVTTKLLQVAKRQAQTAAQVADAG